MTLERAVEILNRHRHAGFAGWSIEFCAGSSYVKGAFYNFSKFEALVVAEAYERADRERWYAAAEALPSNDRAVLVISHNRTMAVARLYTMPTIDGLRSFWVVNDGELWGVPDTHWRELPDGPPNRGGG